MEIFSVSVTSGVDSTLSMTYEGSLNSTITGSVFATETSTGDIASVSATQVIDSHTIPWYMSSSVLRESVNGFLNYTDGDVVTLSVGNVVLGDIDTTDNGLNSIFMHDIAGVDASDMDNQYVQNLAVFLQSIDEDGDASNGITISEITHHLFADIDLDLASASLNMVNQILLEQGFEPVPVTQAMAHVEQALQDSGEVAAVDTVERVYELDLQVLRKIWGRRIQCDFDNLPEDAFMSWGKAKVTTGLSVIKNSRKQKA